MAKKGSAAKKSPAKTKPAKKQASGRVRQLSKKETKTAAKTRARAEIMERPALPNIWHLTKQAAEVLKNHWKTFTAIMVVYLILNIIFASGISSLSNAVSQIKSDLNSSSGQSHPLISGSTAFLGLLVSGGASGSATGSTLQIALLIIVSLSVIWALRQFAAGKAATAKLAYYNGMAPLIPFLLVLFWVFIQLLPISLGSAILSAIAASIGAIGAGWSVIFILILLLLLAWSIYMVSVSIFALYVVTLPNMQPRMALRSAKNLVHFRRWPIIRKLVFLPILLLVALGIIVIPLILYASPAAPPVFYILSALALIFAHSYLYNLYRNLLA